MARKCKAGVYQYGVPSSGGQIVDENVRISCKQ